MLHFTVTCSYRISLRFLSKRIHFLGYFCFSYKDLFSYLHSPYPNTNTNNVIIIFQRKKESYQMVQIWLSTQFKIAAQPLSTSIQ